LLSKYITSYRDDGLEFKMCLYEEIDRLKQTLTEKINKSDKNLAEKLNKVIEKIKNYNTREIDKALMTEVLTVQSLVDELGNNSNGD
jgi:predicted transcriptional regulator